jgi:hypothetical protein
MPALLDFLCSRERSFLFGTAYLVLEFVPGVSFTGLGYRERQKSYAGVVHKSTKLKCELNVTDSPLAIHVDRRALAR